MVDALLTRTPARRELVLVNGESCLLFEDGMNVGDRGTCNETFVSAQPATVKWQHEEPTRLNAIFYLATRIRLSV